MLAIITALTMLTAPQAEIPVYAWYGIPAHHTSLERYEQLRDAGFTGSIGTFPSLETATQALDAAEANGIKLVLACPELRTDTEATVDALKSHPAMAGYIIRDEPGAELFPQLADTVARLRILDPDHPAYINLFPTYATPEQLGTPDYETHVEQYLTTVNPAVLSFDHYPVLAEGGAIRLRADYYRNLEIIRRKAREHEKPFWAFALSVAHDPYPVPTEAHLRLQQFSNLLYGAQALQYFTYWTPVSNTWDFHTGPIAPDGTLTNVYEHVRAVNALLQQYATVFNGATIDRVMHLTPTPPDGTTPFTPDEHLTKLEATGENTHLLVTRLRNDGKEYAVLLNLSFDAPVTVTIESGISPWCRVSPGLPSEAMCAETWKTFELPPAMPVVLAWPAGAAPTPGATDSASSHTTSETPG